MTKPLTAAPVGNACGESVTARAAMISGVALSLLTSLICAADAAPRQQRYFFLSPSTGWFAPARPIQVVRSTKRQKKSRTDSAMKASPEKQGFPDVPRGVQQIVVSIGTQRITLFSNGVPVAQGPVSTGTASHPTPLGVFSVIEKDRYHRSNLYGNAPMFYMQRLTWSGVAMHEGPLPGYPASHGCIRLTTNFAVRLWPTTRLGVRVIVARGELTPVEFSHPALFVPRPKPAEPTVAMNVMTDGRVTPPLRMAEAMSPESDSATLPDVVSAAPERSDRVAQKEAKENGDAAENAFGPIMAPVKETLPAATAPMTPGELRQSVGVPQPVEPDARSSASEPASAAADDAKPAPASDPLKPPATKLKATDQPIKRKGQVAVFVSRKEKKLFVRQGFMPLFEMPVAIEDPDKPLGTHVFTAMEVTENGAGMRWNLFTVPSNSRQPELSGKKMNGKEIRAPSTPAEALERIRMPAEAVNRIGELLIPGSSLVVSDEGLGRETGRSTEFIVLTR